MARFPSPKFYGEKFMRYMLLIYTREDAIAKSSQEEMQQVMNGHYAVMQEARTKGALEQAEPLANTNTATTVRLQNGAFHHYRWAIRRDLAGYYILDCKDLDEAIAWATKIPTA